MCKHGNMFSLAVLIGRGLDHIPFWISSSFPLCFFRFIQFSGCTLYQVQFIYYAPLAQLVEHLTLNQGVPGSSP